MISDRAVRLLSRAFIKALESGAITAHELREAALAVEIGEPRPDLATKLRTLADGFDRGRE